MGDAGLNQMQAGAHATVNAEQQRCLWAAFFSLLCFSPQGYRTSLA
jgi:hypothetical protein